MTPTLGVTYSCFFDFTSRFGVCATNEEIVLAEVYHRLTTDNVIGDTPEAADWGDDVRKLQGAPLTEPQIAGLGPRFALVVQRSPLILTADIVVTSEPAPTGFVALLFAVTVTTPAGTFYFVFRLTPETFEQVGQTS